MSGLKQSDFFFIKHNTLVVLGNIFYLKKDHQIPKFVQYPKLIICGTCFLKKMNTYASSLGIFVT